MDMLQNKTTTTTSHLNSDSPQEPQLATIPWFPFYVCSEGEPLAIPVKHQICQVVLKETQCTNSSHENNPLASSFLSCHWTQEGISISFYMLAAQ